jgi:hypothetical protein
MATCGFLGWEETTARNRCRGYLLRIKAFNTEETEKSSRRTLRKHLLISVFSEVEVFSVTSVLKAFQMTPRLDSPAPTDLP